MWKNCFYRQQWVFEMKMYFKHPILRIAAVPFFFFFFFKFTLQPTQVIIQSCLVSLLVGVAMETTATTEPSEATQAC